MPKHELARLSRGLLHSVTLADVERLEPVFAKMHPSGWVLPDWLVLLRHTAKAQ